MKIEIETVRRVLERNPDMRDKVGKESPRGYADYRKQRGFVFIDNILSRDNFGILIEEFASLCVMCGHSYDGETIRVDKFGEHTVEVKEFICELDLRDSNFIEILCDEIVAVTLHELIHLQGFEDESIAGFGDEFVSRPYCSQFVKKSRGG